jgi:hypothetical protein
MHMSLPVKTWAQFDRRIRNGDVPLLAHLSRFRKAILVAGCQRSGTTAVTRILREALEMPDLTFTKDDELDAALILNGAVPFETNARCCFQTTYINDHFREYFEHNDYKLIWIIRRPEAVVRSMLFNWRRGALNRLFRACGRHALDDQGVRRFRYFGTHGFSRLEMACLSFNVKTLQLHEIAAKLGPERLYILDYDDLISRSDTLLPAIFSFASVPYDTRLLRRLQKQNQPERAQLNASKQRKIRQMCEHEYERAVDLAKMSAPRVQVSRRFDEQRER